MSERDDLASRREVYDQGTLSRADLERDPVILLERWLADAQSAQAPEPNAMTLATATPDGTPSARTVLLKGLDERGLCFFTNRTSQKGNELAANPRAALCFLWHTLHRQVRVTGIVAPMGDDESVSYFASRPRGSQLGAWASPQSRVVDDRAALEDQFARTEARFGDDEIPLPPFWGGYRLVPTSLEFWQGRRDRLHDRFRFTRTDGTQDWRVERLAP